MTFRQVIAQYSPIDCKNKLNSLLAAVERNFGVFSPDMELDIKSIIKNPDVEDYFDRIIHEEYPKLEYDDEPKRLLDNKQKKKNIINFPNSRMMPWDDEEQDCTVIGIDFNYPINVTVCVAYRRNGKLRRERIDVDTSVVSIFAEKKYIIRPKARILMLAYTLLTLKYKGITFDYIHYTLRGQRIKNVDTSDLWGRANGIYEQLCAPDDVITRAGQYNFRPSKRTDYLKRIFKIDTPDLEFFKWGLPLNSHTGWAIAVFLTNPTSLREKRKKEYQNYVATEKTKIKTEKSKSKKGKSKSKKEMSDNNSFSYVNSNWGQTWGSYNLVDD